MYAAACLVLAGTQTSPRSRKQEQLRQHLHHPMASSPEEITVVIPPRLPPREAPLIGTAIIVSPWYGILSMKP